MRGEAVPVRESRERERCRQWAGGRDGLATKWAGRAGWRGGMQGARLVTLSWPNLLGYSFVYLVFPYIYMVYTIY